MKANTLKILQGSYIFDKKGQKIEQTQHFEHDFFLTHTFEIQNTQSRGS